MRLFTHHPTKRVVYIAPLKALVRERLDDWGNKLCPILDKKLIELTGDYTPDIRSLSAADIIIATPEKWDGISRNWQSRSYVRRVGLMVIDEIHLLGADRGPIIEVIVSRMRYIASQMKTEIRILGLSTALANAPDVAEWMGVDEDGLFNFRPSVRPVPLECHIQGFSGEDRVGGLVENGGCREVLLSEDGVDEQTGLCRDSDSLAEETGVGVCIQS